MYAYMCCLRLMSYSINVVYFCFVLNVIIEGTDKNVMNYLYYYKI